MTGNVWEWTSDAYGDYPFPPVESPTRVYRGGSWSRRFEKWMRLQLRNRGEPSFQGAHLGFRCVRTADGAVCPFDRASDGACVQGVLAAECRPGKAWNGERCAPTDAHGETDLDQLPYGVVTARRAWAQPKNVINCMSAADLRAWLKSKRQKMGAG